MENKYFIEKDFLGFPKGILKGVYEDNILINGDYRLPKKFTNKMKSFSNLEDILKYNICSCGKECDYNKELHDIVKRLINNGK